MKSHPLFAWLGQEPDQIPLARLNAYSAALGLDARVVTHHALRGEGQPLDAFLQAALTRFDRAYVERELGAGFVAAVAFMTPNHRAGFLFVRPTTPAAVALWAIGLADLDNPLPVRQRLSELCAPTLTPIAPCAPADRTRQLAQAELSRLHAPTLQGAFDLLIDGLQLHAHGLPGLMFDQGEGRL
jgi:hypothetical protein